MIDFHMYYRFPYLNLNILLFWITNYSSSLRLLMLKN